MSRGKYSPNLPHRSGDSYKTFRYNAKGEVPPMSQSLDKFDNEVHFVNYDSEGFDSYGYSAYDVDGEYVGFGFGVDREGNTEMEYLNDEDLWNRTF